MTAVLQQGVGASSCLAAGSSSFRTRLFLGSFSCPCGHGVVVFSLASGCSPGDGASISLPAARPPRRRFASQGEVSLCPAVAQLALALRLASDGPASPGCDSCEVPERSPGPILPHSS